MTEQQLARPVIRGSGAAWPARTGSGVAAAAALAALSGAVVALLMPRGPVVTAETLAVMGVALVTGLVGGAMVRSRRGALLLPLAHLSVLELTRLGAAGPTVDLPRLDNAYGFLALILGRGFYLLVGVMPMLLGAGLGVRVFQLSKKTGPWWSWAALGLGAVVVLALAVAAAWPAHTPPILGEDGEALPGSLTELVSVRLGDHEQTIMIRAYDADNPVLLYLSGGPGQSDLPFVRVLLDDLSRDFVVVGWDQRGAGKSYAALEPLDTLTLEGAIRDTTELSQYLSQRFGEDRIYLLGESWGSTLAVLAAQRHPELYHAVIGSGQMVSPLETDRRIHADLLALARRTGDAALAARLSAYGEPPYADIPYANADVMGQYPRLEPPYTPPLDYMTLGSRAGLGPWGVLGSEYTLTDKVNVLRGLIDMFTVMYPQLQDLDFRRDVPRLDVPYYLLHGAAELNARRSLATEWYRALDAPVKRRFTFENAGHSVAFEQFTAVRTLLRETVLPETDVR